MKKILLIGKLDRTIENLYVCLSEQFSVQLCVENKELVRSITKIVKPDMVMIGSLGLGGAEMEIMDWFWKCYSRVPVLVIGTEEECAEYQGYFENPQIDKLLKPISRAQLLAKCDEVLRTVEPEEKTDEAEGNTQSKENGSNEGEDGRKTILVVDDSPLALRSVKAMLDDKYRVIVATGGEKAITMIAKKHPDLILLDYEMPEMNGKITLEKIREDVTMADIPVVFLTAVADKEHIAAVLRLNPAGYFLKPLERDKVLAKVEQVLEKC